MTHTSLFRGRCLDSTCNALSSPGPPNNGCKDTNLAVTCRPLINIYWRERSCFFLLAFAVVHLFVNILHSLAGSISGTLRLRAQASRYAEKKQLNCPSTKIIKLIKKNKPLNHLPVKQTGYEQIR